jgi:uncharacterized protein YecE (DUF72 family)
LTLPATAWPSQDLHVGISGWTYAGWRGRFYPKKLAHRLELQFASREFNSIEINGSFYSLQLPSSYQRWYAETPQGFIFSVKGGRFITHMKKLLNIEAPLANFFASGVLCLREKLGPVLWQFPPNFGWNEKRFADFFELLPHNTRAAARLARKHDAKVKGRAWTKTDAARAIRHAVEIRHPTFMVPEFFTLLRRHNIAFVVADTAGKWPYAEDLTADFAYCRLHGAEQLYVSGYSDKELDRWADRIKLWRKGKQPKDARLVSDSRASPSRREVYIYFDNDAKVHAPFNARTLASKLQLQGATV